MWKHVPVLFSLKAGRKDLTKRPKPLSSQHPPPPPHPTVFCRVARGFSYLVYPNWAFFRRKGAIGCVWWGGEGGGWVERELQACLSKSFLPAFRKKQHRNIFSHHTGRLVKFGWILTYLKLSVEMAVTWFLPGAIQMFAACDWMDDFSCVKSVLRGFSLARTHLCTNFYMPFSWVCLYEYYDKVQYMCFGHDCPKTMTVVVAPGVLLQPTEGPWRVISCFALFSSGARAHSELGGALLTMNSLCNNCNFSAP